MNNYTRWYMHYLKKPWEGLFEWGQIAQIIILSTSFAGFCTAIEAYQLNYAMAVLCAYLFFELVPPLIAVTRNMRTLLLSDLDRHVNTIADRVTSIETKYGNKQIADSLNKYDACAESDAKAKIRETILQQYKEITDHVSWLRGTLAEVEVLSRKLGHLQLTSEDKIKLDELGKLAESNVRKTASMLGMFDGVDLGELSTDAEVSYAHSLLCLQNLSALLVLESLEEDTWKTLAQNRVRQIATDQIIELIPAGLQPADESNVIQIVSRDLKKCEP